jgi:hypothetical protein
VVGDGAAPGPRALRAWLGVALFAALGVALAVAAAGCGGSEDVQAGAGSPPLQRFVSRPDLTAPQVRVIVSRPRAAEGFIFLSPKKDGAPGGPMILDEQGSLVWFEPVQPEQAADFRVQRYRGEPVLTWWEGTQPTIGIGDGRFVIVDQAYREIAEVRAGNGLAGDLHEFVITPDDTALIIAYEPVPHDLTAVGGPRDGWIWDCIVQEIDIASGDVLFEWRSIDHIPVEESAQREPAKTATRETPFDYFHANSVDLDDDGGLIVSARNTSAVYKIDRATGEVLWTLGGDYSDFEMGSGTTFAWQHDARRLPDGTLMLFDNSAIPEVAEESRAIVLELDEETMRATRVRQLTHPRKLLAPHQGNAQHLEGGHVLVGWGGVPRVTEYTEDGSIVFDAAIRVGDSYRAYRLPWTGRPDEPPAAAVRPGGDGDITVYASWNGATDAAEWRVLTGDAGPAAEPRQTVPRTGFETAIDVREPGAVVVVEALDARGTVLGRSAAIAVELPEG